MMILDYASVFLYKFFFAMCCSTYLHLKIILIVLRIIQPAGQLMLNLFIKGHYFGQWQMLLVDDDNEWSALILRFSDVNYV